MPKKASNSFQEYYNILNDQQKKVVDTVDGALLVLAGPGTGKTQLLSVRAANILKKRKIDPENILILTFTNAAARAMRERLARIVGHKGYDIEVETFHSFANSIVLESEGAIDYVKEKIEISEVEKVRAIEYILDNTKGVEPLRPFGSPYIHRREIETRISELKNEGITPGGFKMELKGVKPDGVNLEEKHISRLKALSLIYENYEKLKDEDSTILFDERGRIDYDDMILIAIDALKKDKALRETFKSQYKYVMVDEYQDTNGAQLELLFTILDPASSNVCCVGDDDQAIYRFQGATLSNFRVLKERIPSLKTIALKNNYRSNEGIIEMSDKIISQLPKEERVEAKTLTSCRKYGSKDVKFLEFLTEEEELAFLVEEVERQVELIKKDKALETEEREKPFNNIAVLVRKRAHILKIIDAFLKAGIPYATDGEEDIRGEKRVRQMLSVLDLVSVSTEGNERRSLALYKVLTSDYVGAKHSDILKLIGFVNKDRHNLFQKFEEHFFHFKKDAGGKILSPQKEESKNLKISQDLRLESPHVLHKAAWAINRLLTDSNNRPVHDMLMNYIEDMRLYKFILKEYENDKVLEIRDLRSLVSFINMIKMSDMAHPALGLNDFMQELDLREIHGMPLQGELATLSQDGVRIYTAHKAKGLEFYSVFIPFCLQQKSWPLRGKPESVPLPPDIYKSKERVDEKSKKKLLNQYDELRLFYVASTRARAQLIYTAAPQEKVIVSPFLSHAGIDSKSGSPPDEGKFLVRFLQKKEKRDLFTGTQDILKDIVSQITLNPTSVNNYIECKRKFLYDNVLRLPGRKNQHLTFGNCAHKALEEIYADYMDSKKYPSFGSFKKYFIKELEYQGVNSSIRSWCLDRLETLKAWYDKESHSPVMPLDLENKLEVSFPEGLAFRGTFDKIEKDQGDGVRVIDYKTGKPDDHIRNMANCRELSSGECDGYFRQLVAYKLLYERNRAPGDKRVVVKGVLQFLEPVSKSVQKYDMNKGEYRNISVDLTEDMVLDLEKLIMDSWRDIQSLKFDKLPERDEKNRCVRCEYDSICWSD